MGCSDGRCKCDRDSLQGEETVSDANALHIEAGPSLLPLKFASSADDRVGN
jgi:hypothetical protein